MTLPRLRVCALHSLSLSIVVASAHAQGVQSPAHKTDPVLAGHHAVYQNPFVLGLRTELNGYLAFKDGKASHWHGQATLATPMSEFADLERVGREYLSSRFTVYLVEPNMAGGRWVSILFIDKPDRIYKAWMYLTGDGVYELRSFKDSGITEAQIAAMRKSHEKLMLDRTRAL